MRNAMIVLAMAMLVCPSAWAKNEGKGGPHKQQSESALEKRGRDVVDETVDAVADELVGKDGKAVPASGRPPGLEKKDKLPPGLEKQNKTPEGWSKGNKSGWDKTAEEPEEGLIRRTVRKIFRGESKGTKPEE